MFMIRNWKSTDAAFTALNTQPDNMLNHKEWRYLCSLVIGRGSFAAGVCGWPGESRLLPHAKAARPGFLDVRTGTAKEPRPKMRTVTMSVAMGSLEPTWARPHL